MAVTQRRKRSVTLVNPAHRKNAGRKRKLSPAQKAAGFGGKRAKAAASRPKHRRRKPVAARSNAPRHRRNRPAAVVHHRRRTAKRKATRANLGKIISFSLPKESTVATATRKNRSHHHKVSAHHRRRPVKANTHRRRARKNPSMGDITGLLTNAVFTVAGAVATKYATQMVLTTSNTGIMGYVGNLVAAFALSWATKAFMKNDRAASAVLAGGMVQLILRLINDYTPYGQYTSNLGMGDYSAAGIGNYMPQNFLTPQRLTNGLYSANLQTYGGVGAGMSGCGSNLYTMNGSGLYAA